MPAKGTAENPVVLLELGSEKPNLTQDDKGMRVAVGEVSAHEGDTAIQVEKDEISSLHPGFGDWKLDFRFKVASGLPAKPYQFWARWRQGGDPNVCMQTFEVWAGADATKLELRASFTMKPKGWEYAWFNAEPSVILKSDDTVIEIRNSGAGHDAKVFDAFLLASPLATLPISGTQDKPLVLLDLGSAPVLAEEQNPTLKYYLGKASAGVDAASVLLEKDEAQVFHQGFGNWGANFSYELTPEIPPGQYRFFARYKSGGEASQVEQKFTVKAGSQPDQMAARVNFNLSNSIPWEYQWLQAKGTVSVFPGDRWLEIQNTGKADGAKVFDAFLLQLETPLGNWMGADAAQIRNRFLAMAKQLPNAKQRLYVLDGKNGNNDFLLRGLATEAVRKYYQDLSVTYLLDKDAEKLARELNIQTLPAAIITDDHYCILGVLAEPKTEAEVAKFLAEPNKIGFIPAPLPVQAETPKALKQGLPEAWLVGGLQDGLAGVSVFGLDGETTLRPNPVLPYLSLQMMGGEMRSWQRSSTQADGSVDIENSTQHAYGWSRGTGYAHVYLHAEQATQALLHLKQSGIKSAVWLDGQALSLTDDVNQPPGFSATAEQLKTLVQGLTTEGLVATAQRDLPQAPQVSKLDLSPGWHNLLVKLVMQHDQGQRFYFTGLLTDTSGKPLDSLKSQLSDPNTDLALNKIAAKLRPIMFVSAPANLPHPGDPIKLRVDLRWHPLLEEPSLTVPLPRIKANLHLRLVDYKGNTIANREVHGVFPDEVDVDFGKIKKPGYYAVFAALQAPDGKMIMNYPADGFSVVQGAVEQKQRAENKKLWNNNYYAFADGYKSFMQDDGYFFWLERMGIYKSYGSYPGFAPEYQAKFEQAKTRGISVFADSSGDSNWLNDKQKDGEAFINKAAKYTRYFKSTNEIDIRLEPQWQALRDPSHWVQRAKWEFEQAHKLRKDAHYVGGSLVRPGDKAGAGQWFKQVLQLGLDNYQDAWDVHAYPQQPPKFNGPIGNGDAEDERGVLAAYTELDKQNSLPFWLGEAGAKAMHGWTGRRWQAEQVAKMLAWVNSRSDYLGIAFCIAHEYDLAYGRLWDYSLGHKPGEAALYTASALIDGLPYKAVTTNDANIQAAYFGETFMIWRTDEKSGDWKMQLRSDKSWVLVDVVGGYQELPVDSAGYANFFISSSPVYVLSRSEYERLTRFK